MKPRSKAERDILEERRVLSSKIQTALREYNPEAANRMATESVAANRRWLEEAFMGVR